ncbi:hypothetical protein HAX54_010965, partial [Datura stramonium]|nr:hypothetical protein [Datura stramonium]
EWTPNNVYKDCAIDEIIIKEYVSYKGLVGATMKQLRIDDTVKRIQIRYIIEDKYENNSVIINVSHSVDSVPVGSLKLVVHLNSIDTLVISSIKSDDSKLIHNNQFDFIISDRKQKDVREAPTYKDKATVVA